MFLETLEPRQMMTIVPEPGTPFFDFPGNYYPDQIYLTAPMDSNLSGPASGTPLQAAQNYLAQNKVLYGLNSSDLTHYIVTDQYTDDDTGLTHIYIQQAYAGLPVADAVGAIHVTASGAVVAAGDNFVRGLSYPNNTVALEPQIGAGEALDAFAAAFFGTTNVLSTSTSEILTPSTGRTQKTIFSNPDLSADPIPVELQYVAEPNGGVDLAWRIIARSATTDNWFDAAVAAEGSRAGQVVRIADWVDEATYNVFPAPVQDPLAGGRAILTDPQSLTASPWGWHDNNGTPAPDYTDTRGNNVFAQEDLNGDDIGGLAAQGGPNLDFNYPLNLVTGPATYTNAAVTNLFYWANLAHDVAADHGFTEAAGNFQVTNYSQRGKANDPVIADAQDEGGLPSPPGARNNANMATPPDGVSPRLQMYIFNITNPNRDGDLAGDIIAHEFTHGTSNRLTGGPANANALQGLQSQGMGEGWSDWFALLLTAKPTDTPNTARPTGNWVLGQATNGPGIRRFPYSFDMTIDPRQLNLFNGDSFPQQNNSEVHNSGEIWASALWDMTQLLIQKYGFSNDLYHGHGGQNVALDTVLLGMKLQPANPTFLQARDAIVLADKILSGGQNYPEIWQAFARRGFGNSATAGRNANSLVVSATFDTPTIPIAVNGTVFNDADGDRVRDPGEAALGNWTIYNDLNNNNSLDTGEPRTVTSAAGTYSFTFFSGQTLRLREVVQPNWQLTSPPGGVYNLTVVAGTTYSNLDFGNQMSSGSISGVKFNDLNANGVRDTGEPGVEGIVIFCDLNGDGKISALEPSAITDRLGRYTIPNLRPGSYIVREVTQPGWIQSFPDPTLVAQGTYPAVVVASNQTTANINFGNVAALDFGDAPTAAQSGFAQSYPTTLAQNGARHGILTGFGLGTGSGAITFRPGQTSKVITVAVAGDLITEGDETFAVTLSNANGATLRTANALAAILNDDSIAGTSLAVGATSGTAAEGNTGTPALTFTVTRSGDTTATSAVNYSIAGSGTTPADATDFAGGTLPSGTVTFAAGETTQVITINVNGDTTLEPDEGYTLTLDTPVGASIALGTAVGTILNDDGPTPTTLSIAATDAVKLEGAAGITLYTFVIFRGGDTSSFSTVDFSVAGTGTSPASADDFAGSTFPSARSIVDSEPDGIPTLNATGDGADDNGVTVLGISPGATALANVTVSLGGYTPGLLQGFVDWNRDGDWNDPGEKIISDRQLSAGTTSIPFQVPDNLGLGTIYARFRYGYEAGLGPTGAALAGEVEDYALNVLANSPVAVNDAFGQSFGTAIIKSGTSGNVLDVLANDFGITQGSPPVQIAPDILASSFPATTARGSTLSIAFDAGLGRNVVLYTPAPGVIGNDSFQYQATAGGLISNFASVQIDVSPPNPIALDDAATINASVASGPQQIDVLANDIPGVGLRVIAAQTLTTGLPANTLAPDATGATLLFNPPAGFRGTVIGEYTIDDSDPTTSPSTARVTVQYVNFVNGIPDPTSATTTPYLAQLSVEILDVATGQPISMIGEDSEFLLRVSSLDLRPGGTFTTRGVEAAFLDLLYNSGFAEPVLTPGGPLGFNIVFNGQPQTLAASSVQAAPAPTATSFAGDASLSSIDGTYTGKTVTLVGGPLNGFQAVVTAYNGATRLFTFAVGSLPIAPPAGTQFVILDPPLSTAGTVQSAASATSFSGDASLSSADDAYNDQNIVFTSGPLVGQSANILDYVGATHTFTVATNALTAAPLPGNAFRIETELYNFSQRGAANSPAPGEIDEVGGAHFQTGGNMPVPVGRLTNPVFTVRMRATNPTPAGVPLRIIGDPADPLNAAQDFSKVILFNDAGGAPIELTDEQVFLRSSGPLTIVGSGEGEFTNFMNPLDVSSDGYVSALDALMVINDINAYGSRSLSQLSLATSGNLPPQNYLDVNLDANVTPLDALMIFNHLNNLLASSGGHGEGEPGEGESPGAVAPAALPPALFAAPSVSSGASAGGQTALVLSSSAAAETAPASPPAVRQASESGPLARRLAKLDADAADEVFSSISNELRQNLRSRLGRR